MRQKMPRFTWENIVQSRGAVYGPQGQQWQRCLYRDTLSIGPRVGTTSTHAHTAHPGPPWLEVVVEEVGVEEGLDATRDPRHPVLAALEVVAVDSVRLL